jgi:hypothetical protein
MRQASRTSRKREPISYLTVFDPGHAALRWPQKDPVAAERLRGQTLKEIESIIRFNLLWRPHLLMRHIDLFDNLALAKFLTTESPRALLQANLLRISSPNRAPFSELFEQWALGGREPQHWHHLLPDQQRIYDDRFATRDIKGLPGIEALIRLEDHSLNLSDLLHTYDTLFHDRHFVIAPPLTLPEGWYANHVLQLWSTEYPTYARSLRLGRSDTANRVEEELQRGAREGWRRRTFFTRLEQLELEQIKRHPRSRDKIRALLTGVRTLVVNAAFYDEFENYVPDVGQTTGRITAVRDLSLLPALPPSALVSHGWQMEPLLSQTIAPPEFLSLADIASFHTDPAYVAFQRSVGRLHNLASRARGSISDHEITVAVTEHIKVLNESVRRAFANRGMKPPTTGTVAEVFMGVDPAVASAVLTALMLATPIPVGIFVSVNMLFAVALRKRVATEKWRELEMVLCRTIEDELMQE